MLKKRLSSAPPASNRRATSAVDAHALPLGLPARVRRLVTSPTYLQADEDAAFLQSPEMCGVRLQLDYWKTEQRLQQQAIEHTVVVYGSTRIAAPAVARRRLAEARAAALAQPDDAEQARAVKVAERLLARSHYYDVARELGELVGSTAGSSVLPKLAIITGGGPGIMEAANRGAFEQHAPSIGLNISLPREQYPNPYVTPDLCFRFHYFAIRKLHLLERAKAGVFFPGGYGTCDELFEVLTLLQTGKIQPLPVVLVGEAYWRSVVNFDFLVDEGMISEADTKLFVFCETAADIWAAIMRWHEAAT
ncbi:AMP nucleosidase [Paraburkholderia kururiensis]|uniref:LOG family protein n=1 Tax=Paraburkholderia kururiensis TaxID=984307 RepID=UPI0039A56E52